MVTKKLSATLSACIVGIALGSAACDGSERPPNASSVDAVCLDLDGDGFGAGCGEGGDCDDRNAYVHAGCDPCTSAAPGCACEVEGAIAACSTPDSVTAAGERVCTRGTLTCHDGRYSACENQTTQVMSAQAVLAYRALINRDAAPVACDPCDKDCFRVEDPLDVVPADGVNLREVDAGGLTIAFEGDASTAVVTPPPLDTAPCTRDVPPDKDCDGIPDGFDAQELTPLATNHSTIFMGIAPGSAAAQRLNLNFNLSSADLYFFLDMSTDVYDASDLPDPSTVLPDADGELEYGDDLDPVRPMGAFKNALAAALNTGSYLPNPAVDCGDRNGDGTPDNELKTMGIAGNLACLIPDITFGAGWFRDVPFGGPLSNDQYVAADRTFLFGHALDLTANATALQNAIAGFSTSEHIVSPSDLYYGNLPEGSTQGLWALATGSELYTGWSRAGIPARHTCPPGTWGYPCFRDASMPIVLHVTDAPLQNGPRAAAGTSPYTGRSCLDAYSAATCNPLDYDADVLLNADPTQSLQRAPNGTYLPLTAGEDIGTAQPVGELVTQLVTYVGNTATMQSNLTRTGFVNCASGTAWSTSAQTSPDIVFRFTVTNPDNSPGHRTPLIVSARGTEFDATLMVLPANTSFVPTATGTCADDSIGGSTIPELARTFANGNYVAILKGYDGTDSGRFQITLGNPALAVAAPFTPHAWSGAGGVSEALRNRDMRVVGLCATPSGDCRTDNPYTLEQTELLARSTGALAADGSPLAFSVNPYGTADAIGTAIVSAVNGLIGDRTMDVSLRLLQNPDDPNPDFRLTVEAIATPGDACGTPTDTNGDGLPDLHPACRPGAHPDFRVTFANPPVPNQVRPNPAPPAERPGGGYLMRLQLVGNGTYILDEIPVYLVPEALATTPPPNPYQRTAVYEQTVFSTGCLANESPRWHVLGWDASVPSGTELDWDICLAQDEADFASCTFTRLGSVVSGGPCTLDSQCDSGYCDASNVCHFVTGPACTVDADCGAMGQCVTQTTGRACMWTGNPVDLTPALRPGTQGLPLMRVRMTMQPNSARSLAPTVNRFRVEYTCAPSR